MTRKSKKSSGHTPLTYYEMNTKFKSSQYGTTTVRLSTDSQLPFGCCALGLSPILDDPVATPSGHIYSREAIVEYLLTKTQELNKARDEYEQYLLSQEAKQERKQEKEKETALVVFENAQTASKKRVRVDDDDEPKKKKSVLAHTSYWLAEYQPEHKTELLEPPPDRPASPYSGNPLKRSQLKPLILKRSDDNNPKVLCTLSEKTISTQPVVALPSGHVILKQCYDDLVKPTMMDPFTSKKIKKEKHVLTLQKGKSGFASSGPVLAKKYRPTIT
mmetsp:Transcript_19559/g.29002  ORF Transcript_19559/g.29002 Transcript_19559/m.29002 type:complete len:274 (-) Transcript_19559:352-1173(-)